MSDHTSLDAASLRLAAIVESSDDAIVSKDLNGVVTSWNRGAERLFGYTAEEMIGQPITTVIPPDRLSEEVEVLTRIRRGDFVEHFETVRRCKDGKLVPVSLAVSPIKTPDGRIVGASKIARDISDRKKAEEALVIAQARAHGAWPGPRHCQAHRGNARRACRRQQRGPGPGRHLPAVAAGSPAPPRR